MALGDCADWLSGGTPSKRTPEFWGGDIPWITSKELHSRFVDDAEFKLTESGVANGSRTVPSEAILLVVRSMALQNGIMVGLTRRPVAFNQDVKGLIARDGIDPHFLYYSLWGNQHKLHGLVDEASHGTKRLNTDQLQEFEIGVPDLNEQRRIARVFRTLDEKIESNRRLAKTLEEIAAALFKARFVDFVGHKDLVKSEIGWSPKGWGIGRVGDVCTFEYGKALPAKSRIPGEAVVVGSSGIVGCHQTRLYDGPGIVVGRKGTAGSVLWIHRNFFPIDTTFAAIAKDGIPPLYLFHALRQANLRHVVADSAVPGLNRDAAYAVGLVLAPLSEIEAFEAAASPCYTLRGQLLEAGDSLEQLRDQLLPCLISGRIQIPDNAGLISEAA
jgi:type I restriction enzyme S subunit